MILANTSPILNFFILIPFISVFSINNLFLSLLSRTLKKVLLISKAKS